MQIVTDIIKISSNKIYQGCHWTQRKKIKDQYLVLTNKFKSINQIDNKVNIDFAFFFKSRPLDSSNCAYMGKMLEDCLVIHGVIKDDTIKHVGKVSYNSNKGNKDYCLITIQLLT